MNYRYRKTWYRRLDVIFKENPQLTTLLNDPTVQTEKKKNIIGKIWKEPDFSPLISSFLKKACESGCIGEIEDILTVWHQCVLDASGILKAKLIYVTEPDHEQLEGIQSFLCMEFHKKNGAAFNGRGSEAFRWFYLKSRRCGI